MSRVLMTKLLITLHLNTASNTYQQVNDTFHNVLQQLNNTLDSVFGFKKKIRDLIVFHVFIGSQKCIK